MAKLIKSIHDMVHYVADKRHAAIQRSAEIDLAVFETSVTLWNELIEQYERTKHIAAQLKPFVLNTTTAGHSGTSLTLDATVHLVLSARNASSNADIELVKHHEWNERLSDVIDPISTTNIVAKQQSTALILSHDPGAEISYDYIKKPTIPEYVVDGTGAYDDAASTDVEWGVDMFSRLANGTLSKLGINLRSQEIVQYSEMLKSKKE